MTIATNTAARSSGDLVGKVALVTGAAGAIGSACVAELLRRGARVLLADLDVRGSERVAAGLDPEGTSTRAARVDVADAASAEAMVQVAAEHFGGLDIAVNCAGHAGQLVAAGDYPLDGWRRCLSVNLDGVFYCLRAEVAAMRARGGGSIVNISSVLGVRGFPGAAAYTASKHAVIGLTKVAAVDHAVDGIRVNAVGPGFIDTPLLDGNLDAQAKVDLHAKHAMNRFGTPDEVAQLVAWLAGGDSSFVTGSFHVVDGGYLAS